MSGAVEAIYIAEQSGQPMRLVTEVVGEAGRGLLGDRHCRPDPATRLDPSCGAEAPPHHEVQDVSLVEAEVLDVLREEHGIELDGAETRRNVVTRGVRLNELVGRQFTLGGMVCEGVELCEPCVSIQRRTGKPVLKPLVHRGGLYARIVGSGSARVGDAIAVVEAAAPA
ncbi:MAG: MOSC domain-containing protein [Chloroflexota bacterium]